MEDERLLGTGEDGIPAAGEGNTTDIDTSVDEETQGNEEETVDTEEHVPLAVVQSIRDELKQVKEQNQLLQQNLMLYQQQMGKGKEEEPKQAEVNLLDGIDEDDIVTGADLKRFVSQLQQSMQEVQQRNQMVLREQQLRSRYPDLDDVVKETVAALQKDDPEMLEAIRLSADPILVAYKVGKARSIGNKTADQKKKEAEKIIENASKAKSASQAKGSAGLSSEDAIMAMSDDDFENYVAKVKAKMT